MSQTENILIVLPALASYPGQRALAGNLSNCQLCERNMDSDRQWNLLITVSFTNTLYARSTIHSSAVLFVILAQKHVTSSSPQGEVTFSIADRRSCKVFKLYMDVHSIDIRTAV